MINLPSSLPGRLAKQRSSTGLPTTNDNQDHPFNDFARENDLLNIEQTALGRLAHLLARDNGIIPHNRGYRRGVYLSFFV